MYIIRLMDHFFVFLGWFCGGDAMLYRQKENYSVCLDLMMYHRFMMTEKCICFALENVPLKLQHTS